MGQTQCAKGESIAPFAGQIPLRRGNTLNPNHFIGFNILARDNVIKPFLVWFQSSATLTQ